MHSEIPKPFTAGIEYSVVDPKLFFSDPDPTFQKISDPDPDLISDPT